jgi:hypothetical protein
MRDYNGKSRVIEAIRYLVRWKGLEWYVLSKVMKGKTRVVQRRVVEEQLG